MSDYRSNLRRNNCSESYKYRGEVERIAKSNLFYDGLDDLLKSNRL